MNWVLVAMIGLPAVAAAGIALLPKGSDDAAKQLALGTSLLVLVLGIVATAVFLVALNVAHAQLLVPPRRVIFRTRWIAAVVIAAVPLLWRVAGPAPRAEAVVVFFLLLAEIVFEAIICGPRERPED